jgi:hypothetical protein
MPLFDLFGQMPIANVDDLRNRRMMPSQNIGEVGPSAPPMPERSPIENIGEVGPAFQSQNIGEVGPSGIPSPMQLPAVNRAGKSDMLPGKSITDRLPGGEPPLNGQVIPPGAPGPSPRAAAPTTVQTPASAYELPLTRERQMKRGLAMALLASGTAGQRVQGLQLLAESERPTPEEAAVIERSRLMRAVGGADVDEATRRRAELGVQIGAQPKDLLEVLGFDATGKKAAETKRENVVKQAMKTAAEAVPTGVLDREANRVNQLLKLHEPGFFNTVTGPLGMLAQYGPQTASRQLGNSLNTIKSIIGFDRLQEMRENSKTGGALGQVSNIELMFLQSVQGSLDQWQKPSILNDNVKDLVASRKMLNQLHALVPLLDAGDPEAIAKYGEIVNRLNEHANEIAERPIKTWNIAPKKPYQHIEERY